MKKVVFLMLGLLMMMPFMVSADSKLKGSIPDAEGDYTKVDNGDGTETRTYKVYVLVEEGNSESQTLVTTADFGFEFGSAIKSFECGDYGEFTASTKATGASSGTCNFTAASGVSGEKIQVGTVVVKVDTSAKDEDCTIEWSFEGSEGKINPETGISIPYLIIGTCAVLGAGVYFVSRRKNKLYKI